MTIVTRFAPSPTGYLHIGGARTALFSWLLAKSQGGKFLLRVEDTDRERSTSEATDAIIEAMAWLDLAAEGEAVFQSARFDLYNAHIDRLLETGHAYWCKCTPDEVEAMREKARAEGRKPKYDGRCRELGQKPAEGSEGWVVRFKGPLDGVTAFDDMVKGPTAVQNAELDDMILRRSDGSPTYNLAVVVDDHAMGVTHVLRGDDHVANTPRQILLYQAFGWDVPKFGHVPMILGPDKAKLSKRHGALSVMEYRTMGYLPEALVNYLARLGWSHGDQEIFSREELVRHFPAGNLGNSPSVFDVKKLEWLNAHYIKESAPARLAALLPEFLGEAKGLKLDPAYLESLIPLLQPRAKTLVEMADMARFFLVDSAELAYDEKAVAEQLKPESRELLSALLPVYEAAPEEGGYTDHKALEAATQAFLDERGLKFKAVAQPLRVALTGKTASPGLFETMCVLGKAESLARIRRALAL